MQRSTVLAVATVALFVFVPGAALGTVNDHNVTGHPGIGISVPDNEVRPGEETALDLVVLNDGNVTNGSLSRPQLEERVTTARAMRVRVESGHGVPVSVNTNEQAVARLPDGASAPVRFSLVVDGDAEPGTYRLPVNVTYNYTQSIDPRTSEYNTTTASRTFNVTLVVEETPRFAVVDVSSNTRVGATGTVNVTLVNTGAATARNATVALTSQNTDLLFGGAASGSRYVGGAWAPGERRTVSYRVTAARSASEQGYAFDATVTYENSEGNTRQSRSLSLGVTPDPEQTFTVVGVDDSVEVGDEGTVAVTLRNDGPLAVADAVVTLRSSSSDVVFGESATASQYVGRWAPGETRVVEANATALPGAEVRNYSVAATVAYEDREGDPGESGRLQFALRPAPEREYEFSAREVSGDLRVGEEGALTGTITNTGERTASNVVVVFESESRTATPDEREYPVGTLAPGESAEFAFDVEVSGSAEAGPRQFTLRPTYRNADDEQRKGESFDARVQVRPERDTFDVSVRSATVERGATAALTVAVTNAGNETLSDVSAALFADDPVSVDDGEAFVDELVPGASTTLTFEVSADSGALTKAYPVEMDFQYEDGDGDTQLSGGYEVAVSVTEPDGGGPPVGPLAALAVAAVLVAAGAYYRYGR